MTTTVAVTTILAFLATYLLHSTVLLGAAWALGRFVVRAEAWRETLWRTALLGGVATTLLAQAMPLTPMRISWPTAPSTSQTLPGREASTARPDAVAAESTARPHELPPSSADPTVSSRDRDSATRRAAEIAGMGEGGPTGLPADEPRVVEAWLPAALVLAWVVVALSLLLRFGVRRVRLSRILRHRRAVTEPALTGSLAELRRSAGLWTPVRLTATPAVSSPLLLARGEICVPERFVTELGPDEQRAALAHELGHLARRDPMWLLAAIVMECVFFFQPLHRIARRGLRESAEYLADAWAVRLSGERLGLARSLSQVAAWVAPDGEPSLAHTVAMAEGGSPLLTRVHRLLEHESEVEPRVAARVAAGVALIVLTAVAVPGVGAEADVRGEPGMKEDPGVGAEPAAEERSATPLSPSEEQSAPSLSPSEEQSAPSVSPSEEQSAPSVSVAEEQSAPSVIRMPVGGGLEARIAAAEERAEGGAASRYWLAWAVPSVLPATTHVSMDSEQGINIHVSDERYPMIRSFGRSAPAAAVLGVQDELASDDDGYDVIVLARIDLASDGPRMTRLAVRSPAMPLRISGDVYWLGAASAEDGFAWQVRSHRRATDRRLAGLTVEAAALHAAAGVEDFLRATAGRTGAGRDVRESAIEGLAYHPSDATFDFLTGVARSDPDLEIRIEAVETLGELDHSQAPDAVRDLTRGGDPRVREEAIESLAERSQDPGVIATFLEVARGDPDPDVRRAAVEAIGEQPADRAVPGLRALVEGEADRDVLVEVTEQLGEIGTPEALEVLDALVAADPGRDVVEEAVEAIAEGFAAELAAPRLEAISRDHPSREVQREALDQLLDLRVGGGGGGEMLLDIALNHADEEWRVDAVERMTDLPAEAAVRLLGRVVAESRDVEVQAEVAEALGEVGTPEALALLEEMVASGASEEVIVEAVEAIGEEFTREQAIPVLQRIVTEHPSARVRREALEQLADLGAVG